MRDTEANTVSGDMFYAPHRAPEIRTDPMSVMAASDMIRSVVDLALRDLELKFVEVHNVHRATEHALRQHIADLEGKLRNANANHEAALDLAESTRRDLERSFEKIKRLRRRKRSAK